MTKLKPIDIAELLQQPSAMALYFRKLWVFQIFLIYIILMIAGLSLITEQKIYYLIINFMILIVFLGFFIFYKNKPKYIINSDGIYDFNLRENKFIAWDNIYKMHSNIRFKNKNYSALIFVFLKNPTLKGLSKKLGYADVNILISGLNYKPEELVLLFFLIFNTQPEKRENLIKATRLLWERHGSLTDFNKELK